jgi:hypothetical protein
MRQHQRRPLRFQFQAIAPLRKFRQLAMILGTDDSRNSRSEMATGTVVPSTQRAVPANVTDLISPRLTNRDRFKKRHLQLEFNFLPKTVQTP